MNRQVDKDYDYGRGKNNEFVGEVISIADTTGCGKVQVRIYGIDDNRQQNPDEEQRWCDIQYPVTTGQVPGSSTMHGLMVGSKITGKFFAGDEQKPMVTGVLNQPPKTM